MIGIWWQAMRLLFRIHEESFKVQIQVRNEGAHEVINGGTLLQHACGQATGGSVSSRDTRGRTVASNPTWEVITQVTGSVWPEAVPDIKAFYFLCNIWLRDLGPNAFPKQFCFCSYYCPPGVMLPDWIVENCWPGQARVSVIWLLVGFQAHLAHSKPNEASVLLQKSWIWVPPHSPAPEGKTPQICRILKVSRTPHPEDSW